MKVLPAIVLFLTAATCDAARVLAVVPFNAGSHFIVMEPLFQSLAARGHNVTVMTAFPQKHPLPNYHQIDFSSKMPVLIGNFSIDLIRNAMPNLFKTNHFISYLGNNMCKTLLPDKEMQDLMHTTEKYDLVITEIFGADCFTYFAYKQKVPLISFVTSTALPWMSDRVGFPDNPSYIPNYFVDYPCTMSFHERLYNTVVWIYSKMMHYFLSDLPTHSLAEKHFGETLPPVHEVVKNTSLVFVNSHFSLVQSRPFPPNVVEVGGIHIKEEQPLPQDLQAILDNSKDGVILFSFGSLVNSTSIKKHIILMFMNVFATIPQEVIFKYEQDLPEAPPNVIMRKWLPQRDIIGHPNVKAVIAHGGLASTIEAVYFAKPLVGVPFFSDQYLNVKNIVRKGAGILVDFDNISQTAISNALKAVLEDPSYAANAKKLSFEFRDRPMTALETAVYWTEYVIRHKGAPQLRPASVGMSYFQYLLLDVVAAFLFMIAAAVALVYLSIKVLCTLVCSKPESAKKKKKEKIHNKKLN